jgi:hypothetical protein
MVHVCLLVLREFIPSPLEVRHVVLAFLRLYLRAPSLIFLCIQQSRILYLFGNNGSGMAQEDPPFHTNHFNQKSPGAKRQEA